MHGLGEHSQGVILKATKSSALRVAGVIQELWSGYGKILRIALEGGEVDAVVVKHVRLRDASNHPRGWNSRASHLRKVRSYEVETAWYRDWSERCDPRCRVPRFLGCESGEDEVLIVLEDLDAAGYPVRLSSVDWPQIRICLAWLAHFHASFMNARPKGLWPVGTYWHLDTRAEELEVLEDAPLKGAAKGIDRRLSGAQYQTLVHGDAKLANFCFSEDRKAVAAVDFQYVGGGCGMKDVAYFAGSCLDEQSCETLEAQILDYYFAELGAALKERQVEVNAQAVESEWRELYPLAWTDFHRFLKGWSPGHWKINSYSERLVKEVIAGL